MDGGNAKRLSGTIVPERRATPLAVRSSDRTESIVLRQTLSTGIFLQPCRHSKRKTRDLTTKTRCQALCATNGIYKDPPMAPTVHLSLEQAHNLALRALLARGFSEAQGRAAADTMIAAERDLCTSHGLFRLPLYINSLTGPKVDAKAVPEMSDLAPGVLRVDAKFGFAPLALQMSADPLIKKARTNGIAALAINNTVHIAALWPEVERIAEQGLVAFAFTVAMPYVAPAGGTKALYGTNPMAFAWPRANHPPMVFAQASSVAARGEIQLHLRDGQPIPTGWAIGPDGQPTTDPQTALDGAQLPFGGHKGAAIAMMVELLAGALIGDAFSYEVQERDNGSGAPCGGEFLMAIDPARYTPGGDANAALTHAENLFSRILDIDGTRLPSDRRFAARKSTATNGIHIPQSLHDEINAML
jgi:delta1-piperideine-2-carboxylate reductase